LQAHIYTRKIQHPTDTYNKKNTSNTFQVERNDHYVKPKNIFDAKPGKNVIIKQQGTSQLDEHCQTAQMALIQAALQRAKKIKQNQNSLSFSSLNAQIVHIFCIGNLERLQKKNIFFSAFK
jgi:hypothetical protein